MDRLWSPWRLDYVTRGEPATGCIFCEASRPSEQNAMIVFEGRTCYIILNLYPYNSGHRMVVPSRRIASSSGLTSDEMQELGLLTQRAERALMEAYRPHGSNVVINVGKAAGAGILDHVNVHV